MKCFCLWLWGEASASRHHCVRKMSQCALARCLYQVSMCFILTADRKGLQAQVLLDL
uniref:Uncharacterized protein n=1 Tax=Hyaloperonospora arabidopsidis (strain Emoy2) TaxID=559515 RepID=M4BCR7_HYAAE